MRPSNKSRNRNRNNRRVTSGNIVNRVFDSSGPEGRDRGTPQQVIEKYSALAHDAHLSGDRVAAENFMQHSEHYSRLLSEAQKENDAKQESDVTAANNGADERNFVQDGAGLLGDGDQYEATTEGMPKY